MPAQSLSVRKLIRRLRRLGCRPLRQRVRGSHQRWVTPGLVRFTLVVHHLGHDASLAVLTTVERLLAAEGLSLWPRRRSKSGEVPGE